MIGYKKMEDVYLRNKMFGKFRDNGSSLTKEETLNGIQILKLQQVKTSKI